LAFSIGKSGEGKDSDSYSHDTLKTHSADVQLDYFTSSESKLQAVHGFQRVSLLINKNEQQFVFEPPQGSFGPATGQALARFALSRLVHGIKRVISRLKGGQQSSKLLDLQAGRGKKFPCFIFKRRCKSASSNYNLFPIMSIVWLSEEERTELEALVKKGRSAVRKRLHAEILLKADEGEHGPAWKEALANPPFEPHRLAYASRLSLL
jgi:hypothetical protein